MSEEDTTSKDRYAINAANAEMREGYKTANVERVLSVFADTLTDLRAEAPTFFGPDGKVVLRGRLEKLFRDFDVDFVPIIIDIIIGEGIAVEYGWHEMTLRPKSGGPARTNRTRYMQTWARDSHDAWRIVVFIDNPDQKPELAENVLAQASALRDHERD
jgi:ketosteroid isomerase-like protein